MIVTTSMVVGGSRRESAGSNADLIVREGVFGPGTGAET